MTRQQIIIQHSALLLHSTLYFDCTISQAAFWILGNFYYKLPVVNPQHDDILRFFQSTQEVTYPPLDTL